MIKVALVEDHEPTRSTVQGFLNEAQGMECRHVFSSVPAALKAIPTLPLDVALVDINLPLVSGIECVRSLRETCPKLQILMLTTYSDAEQIFASLKAGANGYLLKRAAPAEIIAAVREVHQGGSPMSQLIARKVVGYFHEARSQAAKPQEEPLTHREEELLGLLAKGFLYKEIADQLKISEGTVRAHLHNIYRKLHVQSRTQAVVKFLRR